jgi:transcriptional regulator with XRE-family HTH domain
MDFRFSDIGNRLKAYRLGKNFSANEVAERLGLSRAALYRLEKGDLKKIETLERLSDLLEVSLQSLMGVGVEYYSNALAFFERMRQLEENSTHILGNFSPFSALLLSADYMRVLRSMLLEAVNSASADPAPTIEHIDKVLDVLEARRVTAMRRRTPIVSIVSARDIERFVRVGLVGHFDLPEGVERERRAAAYAEIERLAQIMERSPIGVQVGIMEGTPPSQTFQVFERTDGATVTLSPYRLGDQPNITSGIAMVTSAPEAVRLFTNTITADWEVAVKNAAGAALLRSILEKAKCVAAATQSR